LREDVAVMINILGHREGKPQFDGFPKALTIPGVAIHLYDKNDVRPRRKMGHVTATGTAAAETRRRAEQAADLIRL
ncbi:MAG TPA: hypothetical protein VKP65_13725, partial [Rhodothermales bacterium]|nr:hypothetical protein [Rhodothermales bacterium]